MVIAPLRELEQELAEVESKLLEILERQEGFLKSPAEVLFRTGGKRLRPALVLLTTRLFGPQPEGAIALAAAVEMIHGASLIHDDVLDGTTVRRGRPTVNASHGNHFSVLLGDFLLCQSLLAVADLDRLVLLQVISAAVADMTMGQILEAVHQGNLEAGTDDYLRIVEGKTAALMAAGCRLAAVLSDAPADQVEAVTRFGHNLGLAFQIVDDVLDFWGDAGVLGKPTGADLREKKYTLPFLDALSQASPGEKKRIREVVSNGSLDNGALQEVIAWMDRYQARQRALTVAQTYADEAGRALLCGIPPSSAREALLQLLGYVTVRER